MPEHEHVLSWRQRKILEVIKEAVRRRGYPPTLKEIGDAVGLSSTDSVRFQLENLQEAGYLTRVFYRPRSIRLANPAERGEEVFGYPLEHLVLTTAHVPSMSSVTAGRSNPGEREIEEILPLPRQVVGEGDLFVVEVMDAAMQGASIVRGDQVVVRREPRVWDGLVAVSLGGEVVVRTLDGDWLMSHHPDYMPRRLDAEARILGSVVAVMRQVPLPVAVVSAQNHALRGDGFEPSLRGAASF